jgi:SulP family sulfate permease
MLSINSGARTRTASLIHSAFLIFVLFEIGNIIHFIPFAVLGGILITVGFTIIDYKGLRDIFKIPKSDALLMLLVMIVTIFAGLLPAFVIGIIFASLSFVKKMANQNIARTESLLLRPANEVDLSTIEPIYLSREVLIQELSGPLFFGFASYFKEALTALPNTRAVIFRMERVPFIDQSGLYALRDVLKHLRKKEIVLYFTGIQPEPREQLFKMGIIPELIQESNLFNSFAHAADELEQFLKGNPSAKLKKTTLKEDLDLDRLKDRLN